MSQVNRPFYRPEVKSKIGDYIRGKISAQSLMHPSRINTKPIDKRQYSLNAPNNFNYNNFTKPEYHTYHKRIRRPPLKDYIEGKVKLSDMISPSKINFIPKERKYHPDIRSYAQEVDEGSKVRFKVSFDETQKLNENIMINRNQAFRTSNGEWCLTSYQTPTQNQGVGPVKTELSLIPLKTFNNPPNGKRRKVMCKIKRVQKGNALTNGEDITEERIIEVPEALLKDKKNVPKFLMDSYNIPCNVSRSKVTSNLRNPLAILNGTDNLDVSASNSGINDENQPHDETFSDSNTEGEGRGENSLMINLRNTSDTNNDHNVPSEQGDYNNTTTYIFEFFEESDAKSAIVEEVDDDNPHPHNDANSYDKSHNNPYSHDNGQSDRYSQYEDYKSQIYLQRELLDLHRGMLKCDKNVMVVEHSVNQVAASLNSIENTQNRELKPIVMNIKNEHDTLKNQMQGLQSENQKLKSTLRMLRKKTVDYEKLIYFISQANNSKMQELETKIQTITQAQVKSIEMQNVYNKNMFKITHQMKRTYSELDSRLCYSSVKSSKNSNSSGVSNTDII